jgi:hypothetical protein
MALMFTRILVLPPGDANLPIGELASANREIGVPGFPYTLKWRAKPALQWNSFVDVSLGPRCRGC